MSHLDDERLALVALGDALDPGDQAHLDACDTCALGLAQFEHAVAVGRSTLDVGSLETPPDRVWDEIVAEIGRPAAVGEGEGTVPSPAAGPRRERRGNDPARMSRRSARAVFALAASIAAVLTVVGVWAVSRPPQVVELASATLEAFPAHPGAVGEAVIEERGDGERLIVVELDAEAQAADVYREVWLITADASALISVGVLEGGRGVFALPEGIDIEEYVLVDISEEPLDGDPAHSGDSIVRGELRSA